MTQDTTPIDLAHLRSDYDRGVLRRHQLEDDPVDQFALWMRDALAADLPEPTAMTLATVDETGAPSARVVLLKGFDRRGFRFFTNYRSQKGRHLAADPRAALCFFWDRLHRQVRLEGTVERLTREESADYFHGRPHASQVSAWCSPQSRPIQDRAELESRHREAADRFAGREVDLPEDWGGFRLVPARVELWQGRRDRLHDRFRYRRTSDGTWTVERLAP